MPKPRGPHNSWEALQALHKALTPDQFYDLYRIPFIEVYFVLNTPDLRDSPVEHRARIFIGSTSGKEEVYMHYIHPTNRRAEPRITYGRYNPHTDSGGDGRRTGMIERRDVMSLVKEWDVPFAGVSTERGVRALGVFFFWRDLFYTKFELKMEELPEELVGAVKEWTAATSPSRKPHPNSGSYVHSVEMHPPGKSAYKDGPLPMEGIENHYGREKAKDPTRDKQNNRVGSATTSFPAVPIITTTPVDTVVDVTSTAPTQVQMHPTWPRNSRLTSLLQPPPLSPPVGLPKSHSQRPHTVPPPPPPSATLNAYKAAVINAQEQGLNLTPSHAQQIKQSVHFNNLVDNIRTYNEASMTVEERTKKLHELREQLLSANATRDTHDMWVLNAYEKELKRLKGVIRGLQWGTG